MRDQVVVWLGYALIIVGVLGMLLGMAIGAKDAFKKINEGGAQFALPDKLLDVIGQLLKAPPAIFFTVVGLIAIILGMTMCGIEVFGGGKCDAAAAYAVTITGEGVNL